MAVGYAHDPRATAKADRLTPLSRGQQSFALTAIQNPHFSPRLPSEGDNEGGREKAVSQGTSPNKQQRPGLRHAGASHTEGLGMDVYSILNVKINE